MSSPANLDVDVLDSAGDLDAIVPEWDRMAQDAGLPYCAPGWVMAWWRHLAPQDAVLRVVVAREDGALAAVAPFLAVPWRAGLWTWSLVGADLASPVEPLGAGAAVAATARAVAGAAPPAARIDLEGLRPGSPWPEALGRTGSTGGPPWRIARPGVPAPAVALGGGDVDDWLKTRSSNFRQQMRRARRKLEQDGGRFRLAGSPDEIDRDLADFERLHLARWDWRGGSMALPPGALEMLAAAGRALGPERFKLISLELDGKVVNSQLFVVAGTEMAYWNGGFDDDYAAYKPSLAGLVEAIALALDQGCTRFDLGPGAQDYKGRFTEDGVDLSSESLIPRGPRYALARALYAPAQVRQEVGRRLTGEQKKRIRRLTGRRRGEA